MRVCLIGPPIVAEFEGNAGSRADLVKRTADLPVGILSLAALLEQQGVELQVFDVNHLFCEVDGLEGAQADGFFFARAADEIKSLEADIFGFGTLAGSYPLTVRLAAEAKRAHPGALVVFGGPQAAAVDIETLEALPFVDLIVRGEADETFPRLLDLFGNREEVAGIPGITYRDGGRAVRTADAPVVDDLDALPTPAYRLWPWIKTARSVSLEAGRGCPFSCTFCSTSTFFRRQYRLKSPGRLIAQMREVRRSLGIEEFHLVHDSFTVSRGKVFEFCEALIRSGEKFRWSCSARTDCVDEELLAVMAKAGCIGVFFGVESGSCRLQEAIGKRLDLDQALAAIRCSDGRGMGSTVSLITGFPDETPDELRATVHFLVDSLRFERVVGQLHLLAPLAGSALHDLYRGRLLCDELFSELTLYSWRQDSADYALILRYPQIFPEFYAFPTRFLERQYLMELRNFIIYSITRFRWLAIAIDQHSGDFVSVFERWRRWLVQHHPAAKAEGEYYVSAAFRSDFLEFVRTAYLYTADAEALAVATLVEYEIGLESLKSRSAAAALPNLEPGDGSLPDLQAVPRLATGVALLSLGADYQSVIECLRHRRSPRDVPQRPVVVADRQGPGESAQAIQLSPLSAALIELCDGQRTAAEIADLFPRLQDGLDQFPPEQACLFALGELAQQGLVVFSPP